MPRKKYYYNVSFLVSTGSEGLMRQTITVETYKPTMSFAELKELAMDKIKSTPRLSGKTWYPASFQLEKAYGAY